MSPILQTLANGSAYGYRSFAAAAAGAFESIATATGTGSSGTITFSSIPSTYASLQIRMFSKDSSNNQNGIRFNSDSGTNYVTHWLLGDGSTTSAAALTSTNRVSYIGQSVGTTSIGGVSIIDVHDYASSTKNKTVRALTGWDTNGSGEIRLTSGLWLNTAAVTSLNIINLGDNFATSTVISLYGIKGA
jgi:hypothetical protein